MLTLKFRPLFLKEFEMKLQVTSTNTFIVQDLLQKIAQKLSNNPQNIKLIIQGKILKNQDDIISQGIKDNQVVDLAIKVGKQCLGGQTSKMSYKLRLKQLPKKKVQKEIISKNQQLQLRFNNQDLKLFGYTTLDSILDIWWQMIPNMNKILNKVPQQSRKQMKQEFLKNPNNIKMFRKQLKTHYGNFNLKQSQSFEQEITFQKIFYAVQKLNYCSSEQFHMMAQMQMNLYKDYPKTKNAERL